MARLNSGVDSFGQGFYPAYSSVHQDTIAIIKSLKHSPFTQYTPIFLLSDDEAIQVEAHLSGISHSRVSEELLGHCMGDEVLCRFAKILESCTNRLVDLAVRYGGEEFAVLLPNVDIEGANHVAELIQAQVERHNIKHSTSPTRSHITVSIGVAEASPTSGTSMGELIVNADKALYKAKESGRNQICTYSQS